MNCTVQTTNNAFDQNMKLKNGITASRCILASFLQRNSLSNISLLYFSTSVVFGKASNLFSGKLHSSVLGCCWVAGINSRQQQLLSLKAETATLVETDKTNSCAVTNLTLSSIISLCLHSFCPIWKPNHVESVLSGISIKLAMRLREYAVHADYAHIRKYAHAAAAKIIAWPSLDLKLMFRHVSVNNFCRRKHLFL